MALRKISIAKHSALWVLRVLAATILLGSALSTIGAEQWWIRIWDFPRVQILIAMLVLAALLWWLDRQGRPWIPLALIMVAGWQFYRVFPYTPMAAPEVARIRADTNARSQCFSVMSFNVLQDNRDYAATIAMLERENPDILLLFETDRAWHTKLQPILARYPEKAVRPLDNRYGLILATRLPLHSVSIQDLAEPDTPSIFATVSAARPFRLIGLHPRPPRPDQDTDERDAELIIAARHASAQSIPVLAIGDFNDVAWSDTSSLFKRIGAFLDPRIGRGNFATFPADKTWLGWPLDHLFVTEEFLLDDMQVLENVGSDHRPVMASLCLDPEQGEPLNDEPETADRNDRADADDIIDEFEEDSAAE